MFIVPKIYGNQLAMTHCHLVIKKLKGLNYLSKKRSLKIKKKMAKNLMVLLWLKSRNRLICNRLVK